MRKDVGARAAARGAVGKPLVAAAWGEARGSRWQLDFLTTVAPSEPDTAEVLNKYMVDE